MLVTGKSVVGIEGQWYDKSCKQPKGAWINRKIYRRSDGRCFSYDDTWKPVNVTDCMECKGELEFNLTFDGYDKFAAKTDISPDDPAIINPPWLYYVVKLPGEVGELCEKIGKVFRDKNGVFLQEDIELIAKELGDILWYLSRISAAFGFRLGQIAYKNMVKLALRKSKGRLTGSGDNR